MTLEGMARQRPSRCAAPITRLCREADVSVFRPVAARDSLATAPCRAESEEARVAHKFEIYKDKAGEFRVRFKYNAETIFSTEGYSSKAGAQNAIASINKNGPVAPIEDNS